MHGYLTIVGHPVAARCHFYLYPKWLQWGRKGDRMFQVLMMTDIEAVEEIQVKGKSCIELRARDKDPMVLKFDSDPELIQWMKQLRRPHLEPQAQGRGHVPKVIFSQQNGAQKVKPTP
uniref:beta-adrenergic receptor kinase 1-like n=1 Tax=Pristiophorus japonicus TaxID=55135 RepID=UPI00398E5A06